MDLTSFRTFKEEDKIRLLESAMLGSTKLYRKCIQNLRFEMVNYAVMQHILHAHPASVVIELANNAIVHPLSADGYICQNRTQSLSLNDFWIEKTSAQVILNKKVSSKLNKIKGTPLEIDSLQKMVIAMAIDAYGYDPDAKRNTATGNNKGSIKSAAEKNGIQIDEETIRDHLKAAWEAHIEAKNLMD